ncbi:FliH/SctL family protein [Schnuerera sp.]|uniref:FliH/SctL family protein n=1 Tax=Schnuerera sp. TaxID=2794844 RepID=UPI002C34B0B1|nr:FliH/SctL family protein [Schnuerera sp.]HSH35113.1 FliH/SctL family protein [Schnuerera sp.]
MSNIIKSFRVIERNIISNDEKDLENITLKKELLEEAKERYNEIIEEAQLEAEKIIENAHDEHDEILNQAYERAQDIFTKSESEGYNKGFKVGKDEGYKDGYEIGYGEGEKDSENLIREALEIKNSYIEKNNTILKDLEQDLIQLVIAIYEKVLYKKVDADEEVIVSLVLNGIDNLEISDKLTIIVSEEDYDMVNKSKDIILSKASLIDELDIRMNMDMKKGDCILETSKGSVDVSINDQLEEVKYLLNSILSNE